MTLGIAAAVAAAACYECGYVLQALEAREAPAEDALHASLLIRLASRRRWLAGTALTLLGAVLQVVALALAPITVVQPVLAFGLVGLLALAHARLGERVGATEVVGVAAVIAGVAAVAAAGPHRSGHVTSALALVLIVAPIAVLTVLPFLVRSRAPLGVAVVAAAGGDALAAVALKLIADALAAGNLGRALLAAAGAAVAGGLALTAEMSALRGLPANRVAPVVLAAQVIVPAAAGVLAFGEPASPALVLGVVLAGAGAGLLGASVTVAGLRSSDAAGQPEALTKHGRGRGKSAERVVR